MEHKNFAFVTHHDLTQSPENGHEISVCEDIFDQILSALPVI